MKFCFQIFICEQLFPFIIKDLLQSRDEYADVVGKQLKRFLSFGMNLGMFPTLFVNLKFSHNLEKNYFFHFLNLITKQK